MKTDDMKIKIDGRDLFVKRKGKGFPLLCLSGFGCSHYNFTFLEDILAKNYELILIDNRGMGKSSHAKNEYDIKDLAQDAKYVMSELFLDNYAVCGISMGGFIAQELCLLEPEKIKGMILCCTKGGGEDFTPSVVLSEQAIRKSFAYGKEAYQQAVMRATVFPELASQNPSLYQEIYQLRLKHHPDLEQLVLQGKAAENFLAKSLPLESINIPTLILAAREDRLIPLVNANELAAKIPKASLEIIDQADHHFFFEQPALVANKIKTFLHKEVL